MLDVRDITVTFGGPPVLDDVSFRAGDGEVVAILGPSGSGKSTLLRVIAGLMTPDAGSVHLDGRDVTDVPTHRRGVGLVFQDEQLFPHLDVAGNVEFGLRMMERAPSRPERTRRVAELLAVVRLDGFERRHVTDLSGGEAKRVALARSLAPSPRVLLLDEPLTGLDRELHDRLAVELAAILRRAATTSLLVTHDPAEAATVADRVVAMAELSGSMQIVELDAEEIRPLRVAVLRDGTPASNVVWPGDDDPGTVHLGVRRRGELVGASTWMPKPFPGASGDRAVQLRGMAVAAHTQGGGIGGALVDAGVRRAFDGGADMVWANARDSALAFYERHGFQVVGDGFVTEDTQLPHHRIRLTRPDPHPDPGDR